MFWIRRVAAFAIILSAACASAGGLPDHYSAEPAPVRLAAGADARSADAYYRHGTAVITRNPAEAARAFAWASRLDPTWAAPVFARRLALLMDDTEYFDRYLSGSSAVHKDPRTLHLDSMYLRALQLNPMVDRSLEAVAFRYMIAENYKRAVRRESPTAHIDEGLLDMAIEDYLRRAGPATRAWVAHAEGRYPLAADLYRSALRGRRGMAAVDLRIDLARVLFRLGDHANAIEEVEAALAELRADESERLVRVYRSKAFLEYFLGMLNEETRSLARSRDHYARALQEDLSYFQPHLRMAALATAAGDRETAGAAYRLALDIAPDNPLVLLSAGTAFAEWGEDEDAERALRHLIHTQPEFALPLYTLGTLLDRRGDPDGAAAAFRAYLELCSRVEPNRRRAEERLGALTHAEGTP